VISHTFQSLNLRAEIGGNSYALNLNGDVILLDAGMHPKEQGEDAIPRYQDVPYDSASAIIITHSHLDHIGTLPLAQREQPSSPVYLTAPCAALGEALLHNSVNVMSSQREELGINDYPLFHHREIDYLRDQWMIRPYEKTFNIDLLGESDTKVTFYDAGHILGSAGVLIENADKTVFYTGDVHFTGHTLTQEVLTMLDNFKNEGLIPEDTPIFMGGLSTKMTLIYDSFSGSTRRHRPNFEILRDMKIRTGNKRRRAPIEYQPGAIYCLSSGMMSEKTTSNVFARSFLQNPANALLFVGYADSETPAGIIKAASTGDVIRLDGTHKVQLNCVVEEFDFSGHARREELLDFAVKSRAKKILLVHGDPPAVEWFQAKLAESLPDSEVIVPQPQETIEF